MALYISVSPPGEVDYGGQDTAHNSSSSNNPSAIHFIQSLFCIEM